jgi:hypothetical protein
MEGTLSYPNLKLVSALSSFLCLVPALILGKTWEPRAVNPRCQHERLDQRVDDLDHPGAARKQALK